MARRTVKARDPKAVAVYCRCSTLEQANEGVSLDAQEAGLRAYCAMRGLATVEVILDAGVSGGVPIGEREGGRRLLDLIAEGRVGAVVAMKLDRVFRDAADCLATTRAWDRAGVALHLIDLGGATIDTSTAMGRMFLTMAAGFAEMEKNLIGERTASALAHKRSRLERVGSVRYGFALAADGVHLVSEPREVEVIAEVRRLRDAGLSLERIAGELHGRAILPRSGGRWHATQIRRILNAA